MSVYKYMPEYLDCDSYRVHRLCRQKHLLNATILYQNEIQNCSFVNWEVQHAVWKQTYNCECMYQDMKLFEEEVRNHLKEIYHMWKNRII